MGWILETVAADGSRVSYDVDKLPFRIGRDPGNELVVAAMGLSRHHAELDRDISGRLRLTDLRSTNGTFVNRERIEGSVLLQGNDVLHFGNAEFRLGDGGTAFAAVQDERTVIVPSGKALSAHFVQREREFMELLDGQGLAVAVQPIVDAADGRLRAYELLGRSTHPQLPGSPMQLFSLAASLGREAELSEAFRRLGVQQMAQRLGNDVALFVNAHPKETFDDRFLRSLRLLREAQPQVRLIVEVHETAVTESARMRELAARLAELDVRFAYDDFGAGQARLNEIGDVPAYCVKFDMGLIRDIHLASDRKRRVVGDLVRLVRDLGSLALAEGVESEAEAEVCRAMGFQLIQGYLTGKPVLLTLNPDGGSA